jgi:hypothetical protein
VIRIERPSRRQAKETGAIGGEFAFKYDRLFEGFLACLACKKHVFLQTRQADLL